MGYNVTYGNEKKNKVRDVDMTIDYVESENILTLSWFNKFLEIDFDDVDFYIKYVKRMKKGEVK